MEVPGRRRAKKRLPGTLVVMSNNNPTNGPLGLNVGDQVTGVSFDVPFTGYLKQVTYLDDYQIWQYRVVLADGQFLPWFYDDGTPYRQREWLKRITPG